jgi:Tol biopolymer transport system component
LADQVDSPAVARKGRRLVYVRRNGAPHIWSVSGNSIEKHALSSTHSEYNPKFSPDGKRIAFESTRSGAEEIWITQADGTRPVQLTNFNRHCGSPRWSGDSRWLVFDCFSPEGQWDAWIADANGGAPRRLTTHISDETAPAFSNDGATVYITSNHIGEPQIYRMPVAGGQPTVVVRKRASTPVESLDGRTLYFLRDGKLASVPVNGGDERLLGPRPLARAFAPARDGIYYIEEQENEAVLMVCDFNGQNRRRIQSLGPAIGISAGLTVSPDGKTFLFGKADGIEADLMLVEYFR